MALGAELRYIAARMPWPPVPPCCSGPTR